MRVLVLFAALVFPALALGANQAACQDKCDNMVKVCQDQCVQRFPKGKQNECKHACSGAEPRCQERCKGDKK